MMYHLSQVLDIINYVTVKYLFGRPRVFFSDFVFECQFYLPSYFLPNKIGSVLL